VRAVVGRVIMQMRVHGIDYQAHFDGRVVLRAGCLAIDARHLNKPPVGDMENLRWPGAEPYEGAFP